MTTVAASQVRSLLELVKPARGQLGVGIIRCVALVGLLLGTSGVLSHVLFAQQSLGKWAVTVAGPTAVVALTLSRRPVTYLAGAAVAVMPFLAVRMSFGSVSFPLAAPVVVACVVVAFFVSREPERSRTARVPSPLRVAAPVAALLLLPSVLRGSNVAFWLLQLAVLIVVGYLVSRAWDLDPEAGSIFFPVWGATLALQGLLAVHEFRTGRPLNFYPSDDSGYAAGYFFSYGDVFRPAGTFYDPISLGNCLALSLPLLLALATQQGAGIRYRLWVGGCALAIAAGLVLTFSRMSWVGAVAGVLLVVALSPAVDRFRQTTVLLVGGVVISATTVALAGALLSARFESIFHPTAAGVSTAQGDEIRQQLWASAWDVFSAHPVFGVGLGRLNPYLVAQAGGRLDTHAHSTYLQILAETGVVGASAVVVLLLTTGVVVVRRIRSGVPDPVARGCVGAVAAMLVVWSTDYTIRFTGVLVFMALPLVLLHATRRGQQPAHVVTSPDNEFGATPRRAAVVGP